MRSRSDRRTAMAATLALATIACDPEPPEQDQVSPVTQEVSDDFIDPPAAASGTMVYEDAEDFAVLNDRSNLRPPDMSEIDYQRSLETVAREELQRTFPEIRYPTQKDVGLLSLRWFVQGNGVVAQNSSTRSFGVAAQFTSSENPACAASVPRKTVDPAESAMLTPEGKGCELDHAAILITDEYGFLVDAVVAEQSEAQR